MTSQLLIGLILTIAVIVMLACVAYGVLGYSPTEAQAIRSGEAEQQVVVEEVRRIHIKRPDRFRHDRLDRHPSYLALMLGAQGYAWSVLSGAQVTSNVTSLDSGTRFFMACCFLVTSMLGLLGSLMGARFWKWRFQRGVHDNLTSDMLGDDIRLPYFFGIGASVMGLSLLIYSTTSFRSTMGSLGGWLTAMFGGACGFIIVMFYLRIHRYARARTVIINEAVAQIERSADG